MTDINKEYKKEYYDEYRNNYYNPDDDNGEPGINLNWKRIQKGFHSVAANDQETAETLSGMQTNLETLNTDVETLKTDVEEIAETISADYTALSNKVTVLKSAIDEYVSIMKPSYSLKGYINRYGDFKAHEGSRSTDFVENNNVIRIELKSIYTSSGAMACAFYDSNKTFISGQGGIEGDANITDIPEGTKYFRFCSVLTSTGPVATLFSSGFTISDFEDEISAINTKVQKLPVVRSLSAKIFKRVGCIGDSYTQGYINLDSGNVRSYEDYAWPHYMEVLTGNKWTNFAKSGSSCKSWIDGGSYSRLTEVQASGNKCQAYVIGLMINDSNPSAHAYVALGTASDIGTNNNTYYAYYYRLIQAVHAVNSDAPIFCNTCPQTDSRFTGYNTAVRTIVEYCKNNSMPVYLCDLAGATYNTTDYYKHPIFTTDLINGHYSSIGYEMMAECYMHVLSDVINTNIADFQGTHLISYDVVS